MSIIPELDAILALTRGRPVTLQMWQSFWDRLEARTSRPGEATAVMASLSTKLPDHQSVAALIESLNASCEAFLSEREPAVNIVGTGGGPRTVNVSTAAAFTAATIGVRVIKTGSRAYTSECGSIDLLERIGVPLAASPIELTTMVQTHGIAFAGAFAYPDRLRMLARRVLPFGMAAIGRGLNQIGPFLSSVPISAQLTGTSDRLLLPLFNHLSTLHPGRRYLLICNDLGVDELVGLVENEVYDSSRRHHFRLNPTDLGLGRGSLDELVPPSDPASRSEQFIQLLGGDGPQAAMDSIALNAAALAIAAGIDDDWEQAVERARQSLDFGLPRALMERVRSPGWPLATDASQ